MTCNTSLVTWDGNSVRVLAYLTGLDDAAVTQSSIAGTIARRVVNLTTGAVVAAGTETLIKTDVIFNTLQTSNGWEVTTAAPGWNLFDTINGTVFTVDADTRFQVEYVLTDAGGFQNVLVTDNFTVKNRT